MAATARWRDTTSAGVLETAGARPEAADRGAIAALLGLGAGRRRVVASTSSHEGYSV